MKQGYIIKTRSYKSRHGLGSSIFWSLVTISAGNKNVKCKRKTFSILYKWFL